MGFLAPLVLIVWTAAAPAVDQPLAVAAAVSLKEAVTDIAAAYEKETGQKVVLTFGSSGQLMGQIRQGAPVDVFVSAAHKQVDTLVEEGLAEQSTRTVLAGNTLVLIVPRDSRLTLEQFTALAGPQVKRIAVGQPKTVPAGDYAMQVIRSHQLEDALADRLIYGANVRQVLDYVERGEVDAGIVYRTDARQSGDRVRVVADAPPNSHVPIDYPAVIVKSTRQPQAARRWITFTLSQPAADILKKYGFAPVNPPETSAAGNPGPHHSHAPIPAPRPAAA